MTEEAPMLVRIHRAKAFYDMRYKNGMAIYYMTRTQVKEIQDKFDVPKWVVDMIQEGIVAEEIVSYYVLRRMGIQ